MADDIKVTEDTAGRSVATDEIAGRNYQIIKLAFGDDGSVKTGRIGSVTFTAKKGRIGS